MSEKTAFVYFKKKFAGIVSQSDAGYTFVYDSDYLKDPDALPISLSMPLDKKEYQSDKLFTFFTGLLPEGWLLRITCAVAKIDEEDKFGLLLHTGQDPVGAVKVVASKEG